MGWFLSRAFVMTFFMLGGMVEVVYQMALDRGMIAPRLRLGRGRRHLHHAFPIRVLRSHVPAIQVLQRVF